MFVGFSPTISHAHAETVLRRIAYCRFRLAVRLSLFPLRDRQGSWQEETCRKANNTWSIKATGMASKLDDRTGVPSRYVANNKVVSSARE